MKKQSPIKILAGALLIAAPLVRPLQAQTCPGATIAGTTSTSGTTPSLLNRPAGIALDGNGNLYVADQDNNRIMMFPPNAASGSPGVQVAGTGTRGNGSDELNKPAGITIDGSGNLYVADTENHRIQKFAPNSANGVTVAGTGTGGYAADQLNKPTDVKLDGNGFIYVADQLNHRIQKFGPNSTAGSLGTTIAGMTVSGLPSFGSSPDRLYSPIGIALDASGNVYVADTRNYRIQKFAPNSAGGDFGTTVAGISGNSGSQPENLDLPFTVTVDAAGYIYVSDSFNYRIQKFAPNSSSGFTGTTVGGTTGISGQDPDQLDVPFGIAVDGAGNVYVADQNNHRIQKFTPTVTQTGTITGLTADESGCPVRLRGAGSGQTFVFTGPNGYVFSEVHRTAGTYQPVAFDVRVPGMYTLQAGASGGCGTSVPAQMTVTVARSCP